MHVHPPFQKQKKICELIKILSQNIGHLKILIKHFFLKKKKKKKRGKCVSVKTGENASEVAIYPML